MPLTFINSVCVLMGIFSAKFSCLFFPLLGHLQMDLQMPWMPAISLYGWLAFQRTSHLYSILCKSIRLHTSVVHTVPGRLCIVQDKATKGYAKVFQIYLNIYKTPHWIIHAKVSCDWLVVNTGQNEVCTSQRYPTSVTVHSEVLFVYLNYTHSS